MLSPALRSFALLLAALTLTLTGGFPTAPVPAAVAASAVQPTTSTRHAVRSDTSISSSDQPQLTVNVDGGSELANNVDLNLEVTVTAPPDTAIDTTQVVLSMRRSLLTSTTAVDSWMAPDATTPAVQLATSAPFQVAAGAQSVIPLSVPAEQIPTWNSRSQEGALGFSVRLGRTGTRTPFVTSWNVTSRDVRDVRLVVPITTPAAGTTALIPAASLGTLTSASGALTQQLAAVDRAPVVLAVDPRIPASIEALGSKAPRSATAWLAQLKAQEHLIPLVYGDADTDTIASLGTRTLPNTDIGKLLPWTRTDITVSPGPTTAGLRLLRSGGYTTAVVRGEALSGTATALSRNRLSNSSTKIVATTTALDEVLSDLNASTTLSEQGRLINQFAANALVESLQKAQPPAVTALLPFGWWQHADQVRALLGATTSAYGLQWSGAIHAESGSRTQIRIGEQLAPATAPTPGAQTLLQSLGTVGTFSKVVTKGVPKTAANRLALTLLSRSWMADSTERQMAITTATTANQGYGTAVQLSSATAVTLVSGNSIIPVPVQNTSDWPVRVYVETAPSNGRAQVTQHVAVNVDPHTSETARVPVSAVANGSVNLVFRLATADGTIIGKPLVRTMTIRAEWEGWVTAILATLLGIFLLAGIIRAFRRGRRGDGPGAPPAKHAH